MLAAKARRYAKPTMGLALRTSMGPQSAPPLRLVLLGDSAAVGVGGLGGGGVCFRGHVILLRP